jgi:hypothetical protein
VIFDPTIDSAMHGELLLPLPIPAPPEDPPVVLTVEFTMVTFPTLA